MLVGPGGFVARGNTILNHGAGEVRTPSGVARLTRVEAVVARALFEADGPARSIEHLVSDCGVGAAVAAVGRLKRTLLNVRSDLKVEGTRQGGWELSRPRTGVLLAASTPAEWAQLKAWHQRHRSPRALHEMRSVPSEGAAAEV
jgi:hypothetical protein